MSLNQLVLAFKILSSLFQLVTAYLVLSNRLVKALLYLFTWTLFGLEEKNGTCFSYQSKPIKEIER